MPLTPSQERFCREYVVDLNGSAAYRRAYPKVKSEKAARANAARLLANANVVARVSELQRECEARTGITADWALQRLKEEAEFAGTGASHPARVSALALVMRHLGLLTEDAPHPDRPMFDLSALTDEQKKQLLDALRTAAGKPSS